MSQPSERKPDLAELFFQQGVERHWRLAAARAVTGWLKQKMMDYELVLGGKTRSFLAESVLAALQTGTIFFRVTDEAPLPARSRVIKIKTPLPSGGNYIWQAVMLEVNQDITEKELLEIGDPILGELFADHLRVGRHKGRLFPQDKVTVKLTGFGRFPDLDSGNGLYSGDFDLNV